MDINIYIFNTHPVDKAEDVVNSTTKYIPAVMFDRRGDVLPIQILYR